MRRRGLHELSRRSHPDLPDRKGLTCPCTPKPRAETRGPTAPRVRCCITRYLTSRAIELVERRAISNPILLS